MYRDDGRGIEDFMGNTKIVNMKDLDENKEDTHEALVFNEEENKKGKK
jgi:hypothetical protein